MYSLSDSFRTPPKRLIQGNLVLSSGSQTAVFSPHTKSDVFPTSIDAGGNGSPPRKIEHSTYGFSPRKQKPLSELDLSDDSNVDITTRAEAQHADLHNTSVVVVDAMSQRLGEDVAEVKVTERLEISPYKVICHSPRAAQISLRNTGDTNLAANISVDLMRSVAIGTSQKEAGGASRSPELGSSRSPSKEETVPEDGADFSDAVLGDDVPESIQEITQELEKPRRKKKTGRVVASRLMNTTAAHRAKSTQQTTNQSLQQSVLHNSGSIRKPLQPDQSNKPQQVGKPSRTQPVKSQLDRPQSESDVKPRGQPVKPKRAQYNRREEIVRSASKPHYLNTRQPSRDGASSTGQGTRRARAPVFSTPVHKEPKMKASTPEDTALVGESFNVSALQVSRMDVNHLINETRSFIAPPEPKRSTAKGKEKLSKTPKPKKFSPHNVTQADLDVHYARYLQWLFLSSKVEKTIATEENEAMLQLQTLALENKKMKQKLSALDTEYDRLRHVTNLDDMVDIQKTLLGPIVNELPQLSQRYKSMALALDTTRHELQTRGVQIPDNPHDQLQFEDELLSALDESGQLLSAIAMKSRRGAPAIEQYAQAINSLGQSAASEEKELHRCRELSKAVQTLTMQDNSLKIAEIEADMKFDCFSLHD